jgi:hypothetical protein
MIGHLGFPHSSFAPLHCKHIHAGGFSTTSIDRATWSSKPVTDDGITLESHSIFLDNHRRNRSSALKPRGELPNNIFDFIHLK